jgi:hypothetical protein
MRCVGGVLGLCGVPTTMPDGPPLKRNPASTRAIATEAVKKIYQHVSSPKDEKYLGQRKALAARFRVRYGSDEGGAPNAVPYFIGVFDTVAALGSPGLLMMIAGVALAVIAGASALLSLVALSFWTWLGILLGGAAVATLIGYLKTYLKFATGIEGVSVWETMHLTHLKMEFYDNQLNPAVRYAKHALSIDENRADFARVPWSNAGADNSDKHFEQVWFAGNHSDVGGSYPENESRLSDISLEWMAEAARSVPNGIEVDENVLHLYPSPVGPQHDECKTGRFGRFWKKAPRAIPSDAPLHPSVIARFEVKRVLHYDVVKAYRPENLKSHPSVSHFYSSAPPVKAKEPTSTS